MDRPARGSHVVDPESRRWEPTDTPGFWTKPLLEDTSGGSTSLMRIEPGACAELHHHESLEEILVLEGQFADQERTYGPGQYCVRAPGARHTTTSTNGCTVLLVYRP